MSSDSPEDAALAALLRDAEVSEDSDPLGLPSRGSTVSTPLRNIPKREPGGGAAGSSSSSSSAQTGKKYRLRLLSKGDPYCLKDIGDGATFCLRENCSTKHSGVQRVSLNSTNGLFVIAKSKDVAFSSPSLRQNEVSEEVWSDDWEDATKPLDEWGELFQAASFNATSTDRARLKVEADRVLESKLFKTPSKKVVRIYAEKRFDDFSPYVEVFGDSKEELAKFKRQISDKTLHTIVPALDKGLGQASEMLENLTVESQKLMMHFEDGLDKVAVKVNSLSESLGSSRDARGSSLVAPTLWGTIGSLSSALGGKQEAATAVTKADLRRTRTELEQQAALVEAATTESIKIAKQTFIRIVTPMVARVKALESTASRKPKPTDQQLLEELLVSSGAEIDQSTTAPGPSTELRIDDLERRAEGTDRIMASLEARLDEVRAEREESAIKFGGVGISSIDEMGPWIDKNFPEKAFGLIMDPYLLLHLIVGKDSNQKSLLDAMKRRKDLNINTEADAKALAALLHEVPEMMHSSSADEVGASDQSSYLSLLKSHDQWGVGARCMKKYIEKRLVQIKTSVMDRIRKEFKYSSVSYGIAVEALEKSVTWLGNLSSFIDRTFESVHLESKYTKRQAWALTTQLVRRVWNDLYAVRLGALDNMEGDQNSMCRAVLWAVFRTHDRMEVYDVANFDDHPSIASEYVKFLATNSGFEQMEAVQKEIAALTKQNKELSAALEKQKKTADQATTAAGEAKKAVDAMERKFASLEKRVNSSPLRKRTVAPVRVERGVKTFRRAYTCQIIGSRTVDWLLSLSPRDWTAIYVEEPTLRSAVGRAVLERLSDILRFTPPSKFETVDVVLVAGSDSELLLRLRGRDWGDTPRIVIGREWESMRQLDAGLASRVSHRSCGGVTDWKGTISTSGWNYEGWIPKVRRDVSHIIKYSEKPVCCDKSPPFEHLPADALLPVYGPWPPVVFHTYATRTNWGARELLPYELAGALDLPVWLMEDAPLLTNWTPSLIKGEPFPLKVLQATLESFFSSGARGVERAQESPFPSKSRFSGRTSHPADPDFTKFDGLVNSLPGTWVEEGTVTMAAAKSDNAAISTRMWDVRILLVLPWVTVVVLETMRKALFAVWQRRITTCFRGFLRRQYGPKWADDLAEGRRSRASTKVEGAAHKQGGYDRSNCVERDREGFRESGGGIFPSCESLFPATTPGKLETASELGITNDRSLLSSCESPFPATSSRIPESEPETKLDDDPSQRFGYDPPTKPSIPSSPSFSKHKRPRGKTLPNQPSRRAARTEALLRDVDIGTEALAQVQAGSWWEWTRGSALLFWRWGTGQQRQDARDGMNIFVQGTLPKNRRAQRKPKEHVLKLVAAKVSKVRQRKYVRRGMVKSLTDYFDVPKGKVDIRMVYNGTTSGLNSALWAPSFYMPTATAAARLMSFYTWCVDLDLGEMFLNFPMDLKIRPFAGVDLTPLASSLGIALRAGEKLWERWERLFMGMKSSPYNAVRYFYLAEEFARGDPSDPQNALRYDRVVMNLPGMDSHDPSLPNVMKWNDRVDRIAGDVITFVDDLRATGYDKENSWQVSRQVASRLQYLGIQDAPRKKRPPDQLPGAWAGCVFVVDRDAIGKTVSQEKWDKARAIIMELCELCHEAEGLAVLNHKDLERKRGFLVHLAMTFESMVPFLKGLHLTLDSWRAGRKEDGWKMSQKEWNIWLNHKQEKEDFSEDDVYRLLHKEAPKTVTATPRLLEDLKALKRIFEPTTAPLVTLRRWRIAMVVYGFGDASGKGFGSTFDRGQGIAYRIGVWKADESDESSNWREFTNVVESLEEEAREGHLNDSVVYFFTDNSTVEAALYKGTSSSPKLLELVIRVKTLETSHNIKLLVSHVSGDRMISQGGDGVSRGSLNEGVMAGLPMISFVPLHLGALERNSVTKNWLKSWAGEKVEFLEPRDWFQRGHDIIGWTKEENALFSFPVHAKGRFVWAPPPAGADVAIEQLRIARIKRQDSSHIFICPRLMTPMWLKQVYKACDVVGYIAPGTPVPPGSFGAPQKCTLLRGNCMECGKRLTWTQGLFCANFGFSVNSCVPCRSVWCPGCYTSDPRVSFHIAEKDATTGKDGERIENDDDRLLNTWRKKKRDKDIFQKARRGDHLMVQFECDCCVFRKVKGRHPIEGNQQDILTQACIRRVLLDSFWSRATSTVTGHANKVDLGIKLCEELGIGVPYLNSGPLPAHDHCGYAVALQMVLQSKASGRYSEDHQQWDTIRKLATAYSNQVRSSASSNSSAFAVGDFEGKSYQRISSDPCASLWFQKFTTGCKHRMGQDWRPDRAISSKQMRHLMHTVERRIRNAKDEATRRKWIYAGCYFAICYVDSLRGSEGLLLDLEGIRDHFETGLDEDYVVIALLGTVKGEHQTRQHLLPTASVTRSGICVRKWIRRVIAANYAEGRTTGPALCDPNGRVLTSHAMDELFHEALCEVFDYNPALFLADIRCHQDIYEKYGVFRSFRRGSDSRAIDMEVKSIDIDVVNRWTKKEKAGTRRPGHQMRHHYADINLLLQPFLRYTRNM